MTRFLAFAALCSLSLSACAQQSAPEAGQKITIGPKAAAEPVYATGTPEARVRDALYAELTEVPDGEYIERGRSGRMGHRSSCGIDRSWRTDPLLQELHSYTGTPRRHHT